MGFGAPREENVWKIDDDGTWLFDDEIMNVDTKDTTYHTVKNPHSFECRTGASVFQHFARPNK